MIFVGVDISKYKHHCCIIHELGEIVQSEFSFENTREGFAVFFLRWNNAAHKKRG